MNITAASAATTARIVALRDSGMGWRTIGAAVGLSAMACSYRYRMAHGVDERARRKHAEALVETLRDEIERLRARVAELEAKG